MAKITLFLDARKKTPYVKLLLSAANKNTTISLGISLDSKDQWAPLLPHGPVVNHPSSKSINTLLKARLASAQEILHAMMIAQVSIHTPA